MNRNYFFVYSPKYPVKKHQKRFLVSANQLHKYIGCNNAFTVFLKAQKMSTNKVTVKFRKYGKIDIYLK